ncbi:hypothetical protein [Kitasatospora sp. NPDC058218]|uniref:hypothetical protein n=1 Tax=Kitasatospora sp. NPDC058218 TaxID=3346385 RepID=UPI0036D8D9A8
MLRTVSLTDFLGVVEVLDFVARRRELGVERLQPVADVVGFPVDLLSHDVVLGHLLSHSAEKEQHQVGGRAPEAREGE